MYLIRQFGYLLRLLKDSEVKIRDKIIILLMIIYIFSPLDLIPAPVFGFSIIDDLIVFGFLINIINNLLKKYGYKEEKKDFKDEDVVENVNYKIEDDDNGDEWNFIPYFYLKT